MGARQALFGFAVALALAAGCGANPDDPESTDLSENVSVIPEAVITGTGQCRSSVLTATATTTTITNATDSAISPTITARFPLELTTLSGDATGFSATLKGVSGGSNFSCLYTAAGPSRMTLAGTECDLPHAFTSTTLTLTRLTAGVGAVSLQAKLDPADDQSRCSVDSCDPASGITHTNAPAGFSCSTNNNVCDGVETCDGAGVCNPGVNAPSGLSCSDGQPCNGAEMCNGSGACVAGALPPAGTSCSDGNYCNGEEYCGQGVCQAGTTPPAANFDDHDPCTTDSCNAAQGGIVNAPIVGCTTNAGAPALDPTSSTQFATSIQFLYTGSTPVQTGVSAGTIDITKAAVIRGRVLGNDGVTALPVSTPATVTVVGHPEYGQTLTRAGGWYDIAVNGGAVYAVDINRTGFLRVQRQVKPQSLAYFMVEDVVLTTPYLSADKFVPGSATSKVVRGATTAAGVDADGSRRALLYFPPSTRITNYTVADGTQMDVQVTEYTVGNGPKRMPGTLPASSGYTYAVGVTLPAALAAGVQDVHFDKNVSLYTNNFTGYPVGATVPLGYYDRTKAAWVGDKTGRIIKVITAPVGGQATIDLDGDGAAETTTTLDSFGIDASERTMLAAQYTAATALWRCAVPHFSDWDANWGFGPPPGAVPPPDSPPLPDDPDDPCQRAGSIIGCETRTLGETLPIYGTPFSLSYQSERAQGFRSRVRIPITDGTTLPSTLLRANIDIEAAGRIFHYQRAAPLAANDAFTWAWDGIDGYGRKIQHGVVNAKITVNFEYSGSPTYSTPSFGATGNVVLGGNRAARTVTLAKTHYIELRRSEPLPLGFGGWTVSANHNLESLEALYFGDGNRRDLSEKEQAPLNYLVDTIAGGGTYPNYNDGTPAIGAYIGSNIPDIYSAPDSTLYIVQGNERIRRVSPAGIIDTIAGLPPVVARSAASDGSPALHAQVTPNRFAMLPDGSLVFAEYNNNQIWKITNEATPTLRLVAGTGATGGGNACDTGTCGDGGPATAAVFLGISDLKTMPDGSLLVADSGHARLRRIDAGGLITTFWFSGSATTYPDKFAFHPDGSILVKLYGDYLEEVPSSGGVGTIPIPYVREPDTSITQANTTWCQQSSSFPGTFYFTPDGAMLYSCGYGVLFRSPKAIYTQIAGSTTQATGYSGDGGIALRALFNLANPLQFDPIGNILVADSYNGRVRRLSPPTARTATGNFRVPAEDGSEIYEFTPDGRHLDTLSALHGKARYAFTYDTTTKQLKTITDEGGNATQISRTSSAVTITAPHGQVTTVNLDANGYASTVVNPVTSEITHLAHTATGLLTDLTDAKGHLHHFEYLADGRLSKDIDATPGSVGTRLATVSSATGYAVEITSPEGRVTRHEISRDMDFGNRSTVDRRAPQAHERRRADDADRLRARRRDDGDAPGRHVVERPERERRPAVGNPRELPEQGRHDERLEEHDARGDAQRGVFDAERPDDDDGRNDHLGALRRGIDDPVDHACLHERLALHLAHHDGRGTTGPRDARLARPRNEGRDSRLYARDPQSGFVQVRRARAHLRDRLGNSRLWHDVQRDDRLREQHDRAGVARRDVQHARQRRSPHLDHAARGSYPRDRVRSRGERYVPDATQPAGTPVRIRPERPARELHAAGWDALGFSEGYVVQL